MGGLPIEKEQRRLSHVLQQAEIYRMQGDLDAAGKQEFEKAKARVFSAASEVLEKFGKRVPPKNPPTWGANPLMDRAKEVDQTPTIPLKLLDHSMVNVFLIEDYFFHPGASHPKEGDTIICYQKQPNVEKPLKLFTINESTAYWEGKPESTLDDIENISWLLSQISIELQLQKAE